MLYDAILSSPSAFEPSSEISDYVYKNEASRPTLVSSRDPS